MPQNSPTGDSVVTYANGILNFGKEMIVYKRLTNKTNKLL